MIEAPHGVNLSFLFFVSIRCARSAKNMYLTWHDVCPGLDACTPPCHLNAVSNHHCHGITKCGCCYDGSMLTCYIRLLSMQALVKTEHRTLVVSDYCMRMMLDNVIPPCSCTGVTQLILRLHDTGLAGL